jgi:hypothetical protein
LPPRPTALATLAPLTTTLPASSHPSS